MSVIGIDLGATKISAGIVIGNKVTKHIQIETKTKASRQEILDQIFSVIKHIKDRKTEAICIGVPAIVDDNGILYETANIPSWKRVNLKKEILSGFNLPVFVENDANCFALGEKYFGLGEKYSNFIGITLGSGMGTGIILDNKLYRGFLGCAGEIAHSPFKDGEIEDYCAKRFFTNKGLDGKKVFLSAEKGDKKSVKILEEYGKNLGMALSYYINGFAPEAIILGGSISKSFGYFKKSMMDSVKEWTSHRMSSRIKILCSKNKDSAILGAASLFYYYYG